MNLAEAHQSLARSAGRGAVTTVAAARRAGVSEYLLREMTTAGMLRRPHRGVLVLAGADAGHATALRAALAALVPGDQAAASHRSAAWLHKMISRPPASPQLTAWGTTHHVLGGVEVHRSSRKAPSLSIDGVRCTSAVRTLVDLAACCTTAELTGALDHALSCGLVSLDRLQGIQGERHRPGARILGDTLRALGYLGDPTPSDLEIRMARLLRRAGLPRPRTQVLAGPGGTFRIDFAYPSLLLAIECYGYAWHHSPTQMEHDHRRQRRLTLDGWTVLVYTWRDVVGDAGRVVTEIAAARSRLAHEADIAG